MRARTKRPVRAEFLDGREHAAGTEVTLMEPLDRERRIWLVEVRVEDPSYVGGAWYDHLELSLSDLDFDSALKDDMKAADEIAAHADASLTNEDDVLVEPGSKALPRKKAA